MQPLTDFNWLTRDQFVITLELHEETKTRLKLAYHNFHIS
jgi:hypothetical protein